MKEDKKKGEISNAESKEVRQDFFSMIVVAIVACLAVLLGCFHYLNYTTFELQRKSRTATEQYNFKHEYNTVALGRLSDEPEQNPMNSGTQENKNIQLNAEKGNSLKLKSTEVYNDEVFYSAYRETTYEKDDITQKESKDYSLSILQTHIRSVAHKEDNLKLTDKELLGDHAERTSEMNTRDINKPSCSMTAAEMKEETTENGMDTEKESKGSTPAVKEKGNTDVSAALESHDESEEQTLKSSEDEMNILPRRDGVKVGYVQKLELVPGNVFDVITRSLRPPIFEVPEFLSEYECQRLIDEATMLGLETSIIHQSDVEIEPTNEETFKGWDSNDDGVISRQEVIDKLRETEYLFFNQADIEQMFNNLNIDQNGNGVMDLDEYQLVTNDRIVRYLHNLATKHGRIIHRNSKHTWLQYGHIEGLAERISSLTKIPVEIIERSERLQVVNYGPEGHYYCHLDSEDIKKNLTCCLANDRRKCRLCRYITVLYFLNDVEEGGETAFPVADNATFDNQCWITNMKHTCDLSINCHQANVFVKPRKGTAIMWYNHLRDEETGWLGEVDLRSYHGGCDVITGQKWIANSWINIIGESPDTLVTYHSK